MTNAPPVQSRSIDDAIAGDEPHRRKWKYLVTSDHLCGRKSHLIVKADEIVGLTADPNGLAVVLLRSGQSVTMGVTFAEAAKELLGIDVR